MPKISRFEPGSFEEHLASLGVAISGGIRSIENDASSVDIYDWKIFKVLLPCLDGQHTFHAVGYAPSSYEGRVSSPIVEFNPEKMEARTRSRIYALKGDPATGQQNGDTTYTWTRWLNVNKVKSTDIEEVTLSYARKDM